MNRKLLFRHGFAGWFAMPFMILFEWLSPFVEVAGYLVNLVAYAFGFLSVTALYSFLFMAIGLGLLLSVTTLAMEELALRTYPRHRQILTLGLYAILENVGFRQLHSVWRTIGFLQWLWRAKKKW
jgi:hypothetical protein